MSPGVSLVARVVLQLRAGIGRWRKPPPESPVWVICRARRGRFSAEMVHTPHVTWVQLFRIHYVSDFLIAAVLLVPMREVTGLGVPA